MKTRMGAARGGSRSISAAKSYRAYMPLKVLSCKLCKDGSKDKRDSGRKFGNTPVVVTVGPSAAMVTITGVDCIMPQCLTQRILNQRSLPKKGNHASEAI